MKINSFYELTERGCCHKKRLHDSVETEDTGLNSVNTKIHGLVSSTWTRYKTAQYKDWDELEKDFRERIEKYREDLQCEETFRQKTEDELGALKRYISEFPAQDLQVAEERVVSFFGNEITLKPNAIRVNDDEIMIYKVFDKKPDISDRGRKEDTAASESKKIFAFIKYGQSLLNPGETKMISVYFIYLRGKGETNDEPFLKRNAKTGKVLKQSKIVSRSALLGKDEAGEFIQTELDDYFKKKFDAWVAGKASCTPEECEKCPDFNECHFVKPVAATPAVVSTKRMRGFLPSPAQKKIISNKNGIMRVIAAAGSGKTWSIIQNILYLLGSCEPQKIVVLAYNRDAANEIEKKLVQANRGIRKGIDKVNVNTFDGLFYNLIKPNYLALGFTEKPEIIEPADCRSIVEELARSGKPIRDMDYRIFNDTKLPSVVRTLVTAFDIIKRQNLCPGDEKKLEQELGMYASTIEGPAAYEDILDMYNVYEETLRSRNLLEYADLPLLVMELYKRNPYVFEPYGYEHFIVDEAQDVDQKEVDILKLMLDTPTFKSLLMVGDDWQSIYGFKGAAPQIIRDLEKVLHSEIPTVMLTENHRSQAKIVDLGNKIIDHNTEKVDKTVISTRPGTVDPEVYGFADRQEEYDWIADKMQKIIASGRYQPEDICYIGANRSVIAGMEKTLLDRGIACNRKNPEYINDNSRVMGVYALHAAWKDNRNTHAIKLFLQARENGELYVRYNAAEITGMIEKEQHRYRLMRRYNDKRRAWAFIRECRKLNMTDELYAQYVYKLCDYAEKGWKTLSAHLDNLEASDKDSYKRRLNYAGVVLTTAHSSKGLEWPVVFLSLTKFDSKELTEKTAREEKNRLVYVGTSRAKDELYVTGQLIAYGDKANRHYNEFLHEVYVGLGKEWNPEQELEIAEQHSKEQTQVISA